MEEKELLKEFITELKELCKERSYPIYKEVDGDVYLLEYHQGTVNQNDIDDLAEEFGVEV